MAGKVLENLAKGITPEEFQDKVRENFEILGSQQYLQGAQLLLDSSITDSQNVNSATYVDLNNFKAAVTCSGGLIVIQASIFVQLTNDNIILGIFIDDDEEPVYETCIGSVDLIRTNLSIQFAVAMGAGKHKIKIKAKNTSGTTVTIGNSAFTKGTFQIMEILGG